MDLLTRPLPPTVGHPGYANYPVYYYTGSGMMKYYGGLDYTEVAAKAVAGWGGYGVQDGAGPQVHAEHLAPNGKAVVTAGWAGGTWGGQCGSTRWVRDADGAHREVAKVMAVLTDTTGRYRWQDITADDWVSCSQAWWIWERGDAVNWDGFAVQCRAKYRHEGACQVDGWRWDRQAGIPLN